jgi:prephenate dehydrogenase
MNHKPLTICIAGLGLIGGSLAIDLRSRGFVSHIIGVETNRQYAAIAELSGMVDETLDLERAVDRSDLIILATPVNVILEQLPGVLDRIGGTKKVVTDMGSTKRSIGRLVDNHPNRHHYVASHPMAGTENSGPLAAIAKLFDHKCAIICDSEKSAPFALEVLEKMYEILNMQLIRMDSREHDISAAYVSHISHISSFALSLCVLEKEKNEKRLLSLAGGGFTSTVRLAGSSADMWAPVFEQNESNVLEVIDTYIEKLQQFKMCIANKDTVGVGKLIVKANEIGKIIR